MVTQISEYTKMTVNTEQQDIAKGHLNKLRIFPRILNEHVESSREIQGVVTSSNIVGQVFRASKDSITALMLTLESAVDTVLHDFEGFADSAALRVQWVKSGTNEASLETTIVKSGSKAMSLPGDILNDAWVDTITLTDYTDFTFNFDFLQDRNFSKLKYEFTVSDGTDTLSHIIAVSDVNVWSRHSVSINSMTDSGTTNKTAITKIGFRVIDKDVGKTAYIDNLSATPLAGDIELKLWDMGVRPPVDSVTKINDGTQYTKLGEAEAASTTLSIQSGKRLYHIHEFRAGADKSVPTNELLTLGNYYVIELKYIDTDVSIYGPDTSFANNYYTSGFAFTTSSESSVISAIGPYSDIMFGIQSRQTIQVVRLYWKFDAQPNGDSSLSIFLEDSNMNISTAVMDHEYAPQQIRDVDLDRRPLILEDGGKFEAYYNDDYTDAVSKFAVSMTYLYVPPVVYG